jgi:hypothetical protein
MKVHIFESTRWYGFDTRIDGSNLPTNKGPWKPFKTVEVEPGDRPRIGIASSEIIDGIELYGFYTAEKKT